MAPDEIVTILNTQFAESSAQEAFIREIERATALGPEWDSYLAAELAVKLRGLVDQWLITGERRDRSEAPFSRNLANTQTARFDVLSYMERYPAIVLLAPDASDLQVSIAEICAPQPHPLNPDVNLAHSLNPFVDLALEATRLFVGLMASDWKWRLCKCVHCCKYFLHPRPRKVYTKGTFCCRQHQSLDAALRSTKAIRERVKSTLIELAAGQLLKLKVNSPDWAESPTVKVRLATQMSRQSFKRGNSNGKVGAQVVTCHWVTRNCLEIERKRMELAFRMKETKLA